MKAPLLLSNRKTNRASAVSFCTLEWLLAGRVAGPQTPFRCHSCGRIGPSSFSMPVPALALAVALLLYMKFLYEISSRKQVSSLPSLRLVVTSLAFGLLAARAVEVFSARKATSHYQSSCKIGNA